ncbi:MAG: LPS-assembly protein LptD [Marivivens sp.]|nr:LPS-assembly protein LptD [Marivivens sp.]
MIRYFIFLLISLIAFAGQLGAQDRAALLADTIFVEPGPKLVAAGNVEVFFEETRLSASRITFDQKSDRLTIEGPIFLVGGDGVIIAASRAALDSRLEFGLLEGARALLDRRLQLASDTIVRKEQLTQFNRVAATSCTVCGNRAPLWAIEADRVTHDADRAQLYFEDARLLVRGVPIFWLPRMRMPDPTVRRSTGFLVPEIRTSDLLGFGYRFPYFVAMGNSRDLLITPYLSPVTKTLEARYRQAFLRGEIEIDAAVSTDEIRPGPPRAYFFGKGRFDILADTELRFDTEIVSDKAYLLEYGISDRDRLDSSIGFSSVTETQLFEGDVTLFQTLRDDETNLSLPPLLSELSYLKDFQDSRLGTLTLSTSLDSHFRFDRETGDEGRDVVRLGAGAAWSKGWEIPNGLLLHTTSEISADAYYTRQDVTGNGLAWRVSPAAGVTLRWPFQRMTASGTQQIIEPIATLAWSTQIGDGDITNEDSTRVEFDQANLFALDRFPGDDRKESGTRAALGAVWSSFSPNGRTTRIAAGRIIRDTPLTFAESTGLNSSPSSWLIAGQLAFPNGLGIELRNIIDDSFDSSLSEARATWASEWMDLSASYIWLEQDPARDRRDSVWEWTLASEFQISEQWRAGIGGRYDVVSNSPARANASLGWKNECVDVELSASRRFTSSTTVQPSTDYQLTVRLLGFAANDGNSASTRSCRN